MGNIPATRINSAPNVGLRPLKARTERINSDPLIKVDDHENADTKLIFSALLTVPSEDKGRSRPFFINNTMRKLNIPTTPKASQRRAERGYWLDKNAQWKDKSWNEVAISSLVSKPLSGNVRKFKGVKKVKVKNVRVVPIADQQK